MASDSDQGRRTIPTLAQFCQRVVSTHVHAYQRLGPGLSEELIRPILNNCSAEVLWRFEEEDPYLAEYTSDIWKSLCLKQWPMLARDPQESGSESWKEEYARCAEENEDKLARTAAKLRVQRQLDEQQKKASSIKITDKLPPAKRSRWGTTAPKTLFQKTKSEAIKMQKGVFSSRMTRPNHQRRALASNAASVARAPPPPSSAPAASGSRVTVRAVAVPRKPLPAARAPGAPTESAAGRAASPAASSPFATSKSTSAASPPQLPSSPPDGRSPPPLRPPAKKNPASTLFMPKHRAYSQLSAHSAARSKP